MAFIVIPLRLIIFCMLCLAMMMSFIARGNISVIILAMSNPINLAINNSTIVEIPDYGTRYDWSAYDQSLVIGAYYWGHILVTLLSSILAEKYGPRKIGGIGFIVGTILTTFIPSAAEYLWLLVTIRFFLGIAMGAIVPAITATITNWAPPEEIGKFNSVPMANGLGIVIDWCISGLIIEHFGWIYSFYIYATVLGLYTVAWFLIIYDSPNNHPKISAAEKEFILKKMNKTTITTKSKNISIYKEIKLDSHMTSVLANLIIKLITIYYMEPWPPLLPMTLSIPVWALASLHFGILYTNHIFLTSAPKYFSDVHHLNIKLIGVLSGIPHLVRFPFSIFFGAVGDYLHKNEILSTAMERKLFAMITFLAAGFLIGLTFLGNELWVAVMFMTLSIGLCSGPSITTLNNTRDLSPTFSTTIFGFLHTIGLTSGFIVPLVVAHFTEEKSSEEEWGHIFLVGAGISIGTGIIYILFGSVKIQKWNTVCDANQFTEIELKPNTVPSNYK